MTLLEYLGKSTTTERGAQVRKASTREAGTCSFCSTQIRGRGIADETVYVLTGDSSVQVRMCRSCFRAVKGSPQ